MVEIYASWSKGLVEDKNALALIKDSNLIDGIELCNYGPQLGLVRDAELKYNLHNAFGLENKALISGDFIDKMISTPNMVKYCNESSPSALGFHAIPNKVESSVKNDFMISNIYRNLKFLDESIQKKIIFETTPFDLINDGRSYEIKDYFSSLEFTNKIIKTTRAGYLFDVAHNLCSSFTRINKGTYKGEVSDYFADLIKIVSKETFQMHLNVPSGNEKEGFVDMHELIKPSRKSSKLVLLLAKEVLDSCPNIHTLTMEMDSNATPIKHAKLMIEQAKIIEKQLL
jgi:hypothetical protein